MALKELALTDLLALPDNEPLWVLNNSMNAAQKYTRSVVRPSDVLIDIRRVQVGKISQASIENIVTSVKYAVMQEDTTPADKSLRESVLKLVLDNLSIQLGQKHRLETTTNKPLVVPHDYQGFPFNCTATIPRNELLENADFRSALEKKLILAITTEDAEWLISYLKEAHTGQEEPDRHRAFQQLICGVEADEKDIANSLTVCPVDRIRRVFEVHAQHQALAARPWYVKLWARLRGVE